MDTLKCSKCHEEKPADQFSKDKTNSRGRQYSCKACQRAWTKAKCQSNAEKDFSNCSPTKVCYRCGEEKLRAEFDGNRTANDGLNGECSDCRRERRRRDGDKIRKSKREHYHKNKEKIQEERIMRKFGLGPGDYDQMMEVQEGRCFICRRHSSEFKRRLAVDHCHGTGVVRGLLCWDCNRGIGLFRDSLSSIGRAKSYLNLPEGWWKEGSLDA